jgi:hypothetical protein
MMCEMTIEERVRRGKKLEAREFRVEVLDEKAKELESKARELLEEAEIAAATADQAAVCQAHGRVVLRV